MSYATDDHAKLQRLRDYFATHQALPSYARAAQLLSYRSTSAVAAFVRRLKKQNFLAATPEGRLLPGRRFFERTVADPKVPAGKPAVAVDLGGHPTFIDQELVRHPSRTLLVRVDGDSMIGAGLLPGDTVVVERNAVPDVGAIVVAQVDGELTIKELARDRQGYYLRPANPKHQDIRPTTGLEVLGVVTGLYRRIH